MFASIRAPDWKSATELAASLILWGFRGHSDTAWTLESTLVRAANQCQCKGDILNHREYWMLRQFERRAFDYLDGVPLPSTKLDWLSLIQHYGGPTRLLDFSHSFYVAAFFAMESAENDAAVWAVNLDMLGSKLKQHMNADSVTENIDDMNCRHSNFLEPFLGLRSPPKQAQRLVVSVEPDRLHRRLTIQQGFFLCATDVQSSFEENLAATLEKERIQSIKPTVVEWDAFQKSGHVYGVIKIVLPRDIHKQALRDLYSMNIHSATLFPGLDGFARSMRYHIRMMGS